MWKTLRKQFDSPDAFVSLALGLAVVLVIGMVTFNYFKTKSELTKEEQKAKEEQQVVSLPTKHTVKAGETLWSIAQNYFKSGYNWVSIAEANSLTNPDFVEAGQVLTIPAAAPITPVGQVSSASTDAPAQKKTYTVAGGDHLWGIASKVYGDGYKWSNIAQANNLTNPDVIFVGTVLMLP